MANIDRYYRNIVNEILNTGDVYLDPNRKGVSRIEIPHYSFEYYFNNGFPILTTKKIAWKQVVAETLWILRGQTHIKYLHENNCHIWDKDAKNYGKNGELDRVYGYQLRSFGGEFDQLKWLVDEMKNNPLSTKKDVTYLNPNDKKHQALTCCHTGFSIMVRKDLSGFDLMFNMGSSDVFLGLPFNISSYGLIAKILEHFTGLKALRLIPNITNAHLYSEHLEQVKTQLERNTWLYDSTELINLPKFNGDIDEWLNSVTVDDFKLIGYESYPSIKAEMLAYNK